MVETGASGPNIALTANAALLLERAASLGDPKLLSSARSALNTIYTRQAAVGRWYANVGALIPMSMSEWAETLYALLADGSPTSLGIAGGGVPALYHSTFEEDGQLLHNTQTQSEPAGVALALRTLAAYPEVTLANKPFAYVMRSRRPDGTISLAAPNDAVSQAYFALAIAQRLASSG